MRQLNTFPFSYRGSWLSILRRPLPGDKDSTAGCVSLRVLAGKLWEYPDVFRLSVRRNGGEIPFDEESSLGLLRLRARDGRGEIVMAFQDEHTLRVRADGLTLCLDLQANEPLRLGAGGWALRAGSMSWLLAVTVVGRVECLKQGQRSVEGKYDSIGVTGAAQNSGERWEIHLEGEISAPAEVLIHRTCCAGVPPFPRGSIEECAAAATMNYRTWSTGCPAVAPEFLKLRDRELETMWNLVVHPLGNFRRTVNITSKIGLVGIWSWDHCWHMLGMASVDPALAWDNMMALFDHQDPCGGLPDTLGANEVLWAFSKPPVHGWILGLLESRHAWFDDAHRREIYPAISRLTQFWLNERDEDGDGIPNYRHGNDSGWDNATVFDTGVPLESPDLATWLILQQDWLARTARRLGWEADAKRWDQGAEEMVSRLMQHFWLNGRFVARRSGTHEPVPSDSLMLRIPLLLGCRLPEAARQWCLNDVLPEGRLRASYGTFSEAKDSPHFESDGYWRGPVWPVTVFIFVEALLANGLPDQALRLSNEFLRHVASEGNFENYRADNGKGVRDSAMAWTASCVLALLESSKPS